MQYVLFVASATEFRIIVKFDWMDCDIERIKLKIAENGFNTEKFDTCCFLQLNGSSTEPGP